MEENQQKGFIHSIETFGTVDGPGIRFVVFFQGCPMRCLYCHNPDTWAIGKDNSNVQQMTTSQILTQYDSCSSFYKNGGITVTGGEPLLQMDFLLELFSACKKHKIPEDTIKGKMDALHTTLDTSGILFNKNDINLVKKFDRLCELTDLVLLDIKHIDNDFHKKLTTHSNQNVLDFAKYLSNKKVDTIIRHVLVPTLNDDEKSLTRLAEFIKTLDNIKGIDILPYHTMAKVKYQNLGLEYPLGETRQGTKEDVQRAKEIILQKIQE